MCQPGSGSAQERNLLVEQELLSEIITLYPDRLTAEELVLWMKDKPSDRGRVALLDALLVLRRSGLVRQNGDVLEPTHAAIRMDEIVNA